VAAAPRDETRLIERLLSDSEFRARFRADPGAAAREAGIEWTDEPGSNGDPMKTLDGRESKSSFAGALMAAAVEGIGLYELGHHVLPGVDDAYASTSSSQHQWDPAEFGQAGTGGTPTPETLNLLENPNLTFDSDGIADLKAGKIDPRIVSVLDAVAEKHKIAISATASDHDKLTAGGSISNHYYGRAFDIAVVDGRPVTPGNLAARQLAVALTSLPASIRPSEIGSPWPLPGSADFSDAAHQNHIHVAFDDPIDPNWTPPAGSALSTTPAAAAAEPAEPDDWSDDPAREDAEEDADAASAIVRAAGAPINPDDLEGNLDDEDAGEDEEDGSNEDEPDEGGDEDDDEESDDGEEEENEGQDEPGEGSNGEDATDDDADGSDNTDDAGNSDSPDDGGSAGTPDAGAVDPDYPGDDAPKEKIAAWMASAAEKRGLPPELPVMASLTESSLRNLDYGDADSVGFFQMRVSIWNQGEYAGYGKQPEKQLDWFLDHAEAIKKQRLARGLSVDDPNEYGQWIADVERPAAQYRGRYQLRLEEARALLRKT